MADDIQVPIDPNPPAFRRFVVDDNDVRGHLALALFVRRWLSGGNSPGVSDLNVQLQQVASDDIETIFGAAANRLVNIQRQNLLTDVSETEFREKAHLNGVLARIEDLKRHFDSSVFRVYDILDGSKAAHEKKMSSIDTKLASIESAVSNKSILKISLLSSGSLSLIIVFIGNLKTIFSQTEWVWDLVLKLIQHK